MSANFILDQGINPGTAPVSQAPEQALNLEDWSEAAIVFHAPGTITATFKIQTAIEPFEALFADTSAVISYSGETGAKSAYLKEFARYIRWKKTTGAGASAITRIDVVAKTRA